MFESIIKNQYDWPALVTASQTKANTFMTPGHAMIPAIVESVNERLKTALEEGDDAEVARLQKYYGNMVPQNYLVEPPVLTKKGYRFGYINRNDGFAYPDSVMTDKRYSLRDVLKAVGIPVHVPTTYEEIDSIVDDDPEKPMLVDLIEFGIDLIIFGFEGMSLERALAYMGQSGFPVIDVLGWYNTGWQDRDHVDYDMWTECHGAIHINSPILENPDVVLPIMGLYTVRSLIEPVKPGRKQFLVNYSLLKVPTVLVDTLGEDGTASIAGPLPAPLSITYDGLPIPPERREFVNFQIQTQNDVSGRLLPIWSDGDTVQLSYNASYINNIQYTKYGKWTNIITGYVTYTDEGGNIYQGVFPIAWMIVALETDRKYFVVKDSKVDPDWEGMSIVNVQCVDQNDQPVGLNSNIPAAGRGIDGDNILKLPTSVGGDLVTIRGVPTDKVNTMRMEIYLLPDGYGNAKDIVKFILNPPSS